MKKSLTILLFLLSFTLCANAQNSGQYVRRQSSQQNTQKSTQKNTQKSTPKNTQKSTQKTSQKSTPQNSPKTAQKSTQKTRQNSKPHKEPCDVVDGAMREVDKLMASGNLQEALDMLRKIKSDPNVQNCEQMSVVNYKIQIVENELAKQNPKSKNTTVGVAQQNTTQKTPTSDKLCPDDNHPHLIDLGLPSGTKWACCNVDDEPATQGPTQFGGYYAWGEVKEKSTYYWSTYIHCDGSQNTCHYLGNDIAGTEYDVAHKRWGGSWCMPSEKQGIELIRNCSSKWVTINGVGGRLLTGPNGNCIFLPAAGYYGNDGFGNPSSGDYCLSTLRSGRSDYNYSLDFDSSTIIRGGGDRMHGRNVRPVSR